MESNIFKILTEEIRSYQDDFIDISDGVKYKQYDLIKNISRFENKVFLNGKLDSQLNYKYWYDIISPRVNDEVKNIDFDRSNIFTYSDSFQDKIAVYLSNLQLKDWLTETGQGEELNDAVEEFSAWGNVVWKKIKGGYERVDLKNFYVLNQTAKTLNESSVIERHQLTQSDLREKEGVWKNVKEVIKTGGNKKLVPVENTEGIKTTNVYYDIYERNGEISEKSLFEAQDKKEEGSEEKFVLAKIIATGLNKSISKDSKYILFAEPIDKMPYHEAHRGRYKSKWFREGIYEILFDCQTRANQLGNQIARGCEWASKVIFRTNDDTFVQNILTDLRNGDILKARDLSQVDVRMQALDQLMVDWNRNLTVADKLANSYEIVSGETMPSNTPFKLGNLLNQNANKLFDFLREKLTIGFESLLNDWILPKLLKDLKAKKIIDLTNSEENLKDYYQMVVNAWYIMNLINLPPHSPEIAQIIKAKKLEEITKNKKAIIEAEKDFWNNAKLRIKVKITGENVRLIADLESLYSFIQLESDPIRRTSLIEMAMMKKNIDISSLPKSTPEQLMGGQRMPATNMNNEMVSAMKTPQPMNR